MKKAIISFQMPDTIIALPEQEIPTIQQMHTRQPFLHSIFSTILGNEQQNNTSDLENMKAKALNAQNLQTCKPYLINVIHMDLKRSVNKVTSCISAYTNILKTVRVQDDFSETFKQSPHPVLLLNDLKEALITGKDFSSLSKNTYNFHHRTSCLIKALASIFINARVNNDCLGELRKALVTMINQNKEHPFNIHKFVRAAPDIAHIITQIEPLDTYSSKENDTVDNHYTIMSRELDKILKISAIFGKK